jgi:hypothetical protein
MLVVNVGLYRGSDGIQSWLMIDHSSLASKDGAQDNEYNELGNKYGDAWLLSRGTSGDESKGAI